MFVEYCGLYVPVDVVAVVGDLATVDQFGVVRVVLASEVVSLQDIPAGSVVV